MRETANLINERNKISEEIAKIIDRPALNQHIGEYIASKIFNIELMPIATAKGIDGYFTQSRLENKSVNIKLYGKKENILDTSKTPADYYLVLTGDDGDLFSSKGKTRPLVISQAFLFICIQ